MIRCCPVNLHVFHALVIHKEQQHCEQSILSIILEWTILICSTASYSLETPSLSFPPSFPPSLRLYSSLPCLPPSSPPLSSSLYISLLLHPSLFLFSSLSLFLLTSLFLPSSLSSAPSHPCPSNILPFLYFASPLFSLLQAFSLNPMLHDTSYSCIFLFLSFYIPLQLPSLSMLFCYTYNTVF